MAVSVPYSRGSLGKDSTICVGTLLFSLSSLNLSCHAKLAELVDRLLAVDWDSSSSSPSLNPIEEEL